MVLAQVRWHVQGPRVCLCVCMCVLAGERGLLSGGAAVCVQGQASAIASGAWTACVGIAVAPTHLLTDWLTVLCH